MIYVGKAKSLRSRLSNYFAPPELAARAHPPDGAGGRDASSGSWSKNEVEAFFLEFNLIKRHRPRFNIRLKDDKSYPFLAVTLDEEWPRAMVLRGQKRKGVRYFGPYAHAYAIRETLDLLLRTFPIRTCTKAKFDRHHRLGRPCLYAHIEKCAAPCVGAIDHDEYDELVAGAARLPRRRARRGARAARQADARAPPTQLEFERAARVRDQLTSVRKAIERQQMVGAARRTSTCIGLAEDPLEASVQVFYVRKGRVVGRKGLIVDKVEDVETPALVARIVEQLYADAPATTCPREILVPVEPEDRELYEEFLALQPRRRRCASACRSGAASASCSRPRRSTRARRSRGTSCGARPITTRAPGRCSRCRRRSTCPRRRCASSASTSRTSRAPRSSARWS